MVSSKISFLILIIVLFSYILVFTFYFDGCKFYKRGQHPFMIMYFLSFILYDLNEGEFQMLIWLCILLVVVEEKNIMV